MTGFTQYGNLLVPEHLAQQPVQSSPIPLSLWQLKTNELYYNRDDNPLNHLGTLGDDDPLLPRALAKDLEGRTAPIHEIGPGNFSFATELARTLDREIQTHDYSNTFYRHNLDNIPDNVRFRKRSFQQFPSEVADDPLSVVCVELLDDLYTEFFAMQEGRTGIFAVQPQMRGDAFFPTRGGYARQQLLEGNFSVEVQSALGKGGEQTYTAQQVVDVIGSGKWDELDNIHPSFLNWLEIKHMEAVEFPLEGVLERYWEGMPEAFVPFSEAVLSRFKEQLASTQGTERDKQVLHLPVSGLKFLWNMHERDVRVDFFDYGYDSTALWLGAFSEYNGQITAPVNFEILQFAAEHFGFKTTLEKNSAFIERTLGVDSVGMKYVLKTLPKRFQEDDTKRHAVWKALMPAVQALYDDKVTIKNVGSRRVPRNHAEAFLEEAHKQGLIKDPTIKEGSFHLTIYH